MTSPAPDIVAADLAKLINPGLRSPRAGLAVLPDLALVQADIHGGARSVADAIESVVNRGLTAMAAGSPDARLPRLAADPVKALRAALALRPGSERVKSKTRRTAAAQALGLLSGDGWRAHHEKPLLRDLAGAICALESGSRDAAQPDGAAGPGAGDSGIVGFYGDFVDIEGDWEALFAASSTLDLAVMYGATWRNTYRKDLHALAGRPGGRILVVLPNPSADSLVLSMYAQSLRITPDDFRRKVRPRLTPTTRPMRPPSACELWARPASPTPGRSTCATSVNAAIDGTSWPPFPPRDTHRPTVQAAVLNCCPRSEEHTSELQ